MADVQTTKVRTAISEAKFFPTEVPCLVFDSENEIHNYLGYRHITGIKEWRLLEKARYLNDLRNNVFSELTLIKASREIAKSIGSRMDYVRRILVGFQVYKNIEDEGFYRIRDLDDTTFYFNYIADSLNKENIRKFIGVSFDLEDPLSELNPENLKKWTLWLFEKNDQNKSRLIGDSHDLNILNNILGSEEATLAFDSKGFTLERAQELTGEQNKQFLQLIRKALDALESADKLAIKVRIASIDIEDDLKSIRLLASNVFRTIRQKEDEEAL